MQVEHTSSEKVDATPQELWDNFISIQKLEELLPAVTGIERQDTGIYVASVEMFGMTWPVTLTAEDSTEPSYLHLKSKQPEFDLHVALSEHDNLTEVTVKAELEPPAQFATQYLDERIESKLQERMDENLMKMKQQVSRSDEWKEN